MIPADSMGSWPVIGLCMLNHFDVHQFSFVLIAICARLSHECMHLTLLSKNIVGMYGLTYLRVLLDRLIGSLLTAAVSSPNFTPIPKACTPSLVDVVHHVWGGPRVVPPPPPPVVGDRCWLVGCDPVTLCTGKLLCPQDGFIRATSISPRNTVTPILHSI